jgi:diadenylate cyclase
VSDLFLILSRRLDFISVIDILLVALAFYWILRLIQGTQAVQLLRGILILAVLAVIAASALNSLTAFSWLIERAFPALLVAIPVIFQPELRRALERLGRTGGLLAGPRQSALVEEAIETVSKAVVGLSEIRHGALIVFERETGLENYIETGIKLDALVTPNLLMTIFFPNTALHDGAVIIRGDRIMAAGIVLPLGGDTMANKEHLGMRHRAALGITDSTDAITIVVSEETGSISVAENGQLYRGLNKKRLEQLLHTFVKNQLTETIPNRFRTGQSILKRLGIMKASKTIIPARSQSKR